jgi:hypothetical protein
MTNSLANSNRRHICCALYDGQLETLRESTYWRGEPVANQDKGYAIRSGDFNNSAATSIGDLCLAYRAHHDRKGLDLVHTL